MCEPGWSFYNGSCYFTSETCETWSNASTICRNMGANLPAIETQEENVYIQHRHNGDKAWIGLNDIATEGLFSWVDGCPNKFRYWAEKQPNDFRGEDCVHTLGPRHGYTWNDVDCSTCHQYTCKKGKNELTRPPFRPTPYANTEYLYYYFFICYDRNIISRFSHFEVVFNKHSSCEILINN